MYVRLREERNFPSKQLTRTALNPSMVVNTICVVRQAGTAITQVGWKIPKD